MGVEDAWTVKIFISFSEISRACSAKVRGMRRENCLRGSSLRFAGVWNMFELGRLILVVTFLSFAFAPATRGETDPYKSKRDYYGDLFDVKVYDPHSKSYFEMKRGWRVGRYQQAFAFPRSQSYNGIRRRLAVIQSKQTQKFINRTFRPFTETWIGLRLRCRPQGLIWVN